ncbi:hypothetical protein R1flu_023322 [Riccia fluitans]|uniref:Uncharacterized protein n=1 Tax=Riccia fluitans TaxID=41844 RepID=A0ABD1XRP5_9MARC
MVTSKDEKAGCKSNALNREGKSVAKEIVENAGQLDELARAASCEKKALLKLQEETNTKTENLKTLFRKKAKVGEDIDDVMKETARLRLYPYLTILAKSGFLNNSTTEYVTTLTKNHGKRRSGRRGGALDIEAQECLQMSQVWSVIPSCKGRDDVRYYFCSILGTELPAFLHTFNWKSCRALD